jgi:Flp pilus assembly protein CpaB
LRRRSNVLVLVGLLAFVLGLAAVYLVTKDEDDGQPLATGPDSVEVVVATEDLAAGTSGDDLLANGGIELRRIPRAQMAQNAVTAPSQLTNTLLSLSFSEDEQLVVSGLRPRSILAQQVELPAGFEAVAVDVRAVAGGAGYVTPGDRVNIYLVTQKCAAENAIPGPSGEEVIQTAVPTSELILTNTQVLDVSQTAAPLRTQATVADTGDAGRSTESGTTTMLLALTTLDVEKVVFGSSVPCYELYVSLVNEDSAPAGPTDGIDYSDVLAEESADAFARSNPTP